MTAENLLRRFRRLAFGFRQRRQKHRRQDGDDGNDHEQFNERERRTTLGAIRKLKDGNGQYLWVPGIVGNVPNTILGAPYVEMPDMPSRLVLSRSS